MGEEAAALGTGLGLFPFGSDLAFSSNSLRFGSPPKTGVRWAKLIGGGGVGATYWPWRWPGGGLYFGRVVPPSTPLSC